MVAGAYFTPGADFPVTALGTAAVLGFGSAEPELSRPRQ
jgi:hypothetical protein